MPKRKRLFYFSVLALILFLIFGATQVFAAGGNYSDTPFKFEFDTLVTTQYTDTRPKYNNTSAYMKLTYLSNSSMSYTARVVDKDGNNFSKVWTYRFSSSNLNQGVYLLNYAWEDRGGDSDVGVPVKIRADRAGHTPFVAKGVWSPDSI
jgi:hypothetical protein